jgi:hypothetical protein
MPHGEQTQLVGVLPMVTPGGAGGIRTPYLLTASQTFSQLNYSPIKTPPNLAENSRKHKSKQVCPGRQHNTHTSPKRPPLPRFSLSCCSLGSISDGKG